MEKRRRLGLRRRTSFRPVALVMLALLLLASSVMPSVVQPVKAANTVTDTSQHLVDEPIAPGILYHEIALSTTDTKQRLNVIEADPFRDDVEIFSSHAKDKVAYNDTLTGQIAREIFKGKNVVGGINGDMFYMGSSTPYSLGIQVKDGAVITGYFKNANYVFGVDDHHRPFIESVRGSGTVTVVKDVYQSASEPEKESVTEQVYGFELDGVNRNIDSFANGLLVITDQYSVYETASTSSGLLIVVDGISQPITLGETHTGVVRQVLAGPGAKSIPVPPDGIVLAANGGKAAELQALIAPGDRIRLHIDTTHAGHIQEAVSGYTMLVENGQALTAEEMIARGVDPIFTWDRKPRTAIGITGEGKVIAVTVDGGQPSYGISDGMSLVEMAETMVSLGAVVALSLDGGGSTTMAVKRFGETNVKIANRPSDGGERVIANAILFATRAERKSDIGEVRVVPQRLTIYKDTAYTFQVKITDQSFRPLDPGQFRVLWGVKNGAIGQIDASGKFRSGPHASEGQIYAAVGDAVGRADIRVVEDVYALQLTETGIVPIKNGETHSFNIVAYDVDGTPIVIKNSSATWHVEGDIGTIDAEGRFTAKADGQGEGVITAIVGEKIASVRVIVGMRDKVIDDFEHGEVERYRVSGYVGEKGGTLEISDEQSKSRNHSLKVTYTYKYWTQYNGTINIIPRKVDKNGNDISEKYTTTIRPKKFGMWVYGDGKAPWLRVILTDGNGQNRTYNLASRIDWTGWRYVDVTIPSDVPLPITLNYFYMVETVQSRQKSDYSGTVYFDDIRFVYADDGEDFKPPTFVNFQPSKSTVYTPDVDIGVTITDDRSGVDKESVHLYLDDQEVEYKIVEEKQLSLTIRYEARGLSEGKHTVRVTARDNDGNVASPYVRTFDVDLKAPTDPPSVSNLLPLDGNRLKTPTPRISAKIQDEKAGVDSEDITFYIDGEQHRPTHYDETSGIAYLIPPKLPVGEHRIVIDAKNRAGISVDRLVKFAPLAGALGVTYTWNGQDRSVTMQKGDVEAVVWIDRPTARVNGEDVALTLAPKIIDGSSYVPLRFMKSIFPFDEALERQYPNGALEATFTVEPSPEPKDPRHYVISLFSDTHATAFGPYFVDLINRDESELVIHIGDLVDLDTPAQWQIGDAHVAGLTKPYIISPGNHEAMGSGSLSNYYSRFGPAIYTMEYGNALLISLNTTFGQSISATDPTQFDYLERVLQTETDGKEQIIVFTHNPTRDTFGTAHEMLYADAVRLEKILSAFKKDHSDKGVTVLFGHLHASMSWEVDGVRYIINGDGALKRYVRPEWGGMLSYTKLIINENHNDFKFIPLVKKISIVDEAIQNGTLKLPVGAERNLQLYGDFSLLTSNYILPLNKTVPINPFTDNVEMKWTSSDPDVIAVDERGRITAKRQGSAILTVVVGGATKSLKVTAVNPADIQPLKLILDPADALTEGETITFQVTAFDAYNNAFALDNKEVAWSVKDNIGSVQDGVFTPRNTDEDRVGYVVALFNQKRAEAKVTVKATARPTNLIVVTNEVHLRKGEQLPLTVRVFDQYGREVPLSKSALHFISSNKNIADVDNDGVITAIGVGQATVQVNYEQLEAVVNVTVTESEFSPEPTPEAALLTVNNRQPYGSYLVNGAGYSLYMYSKDQKGDSSVCTGSCAGNWPPLTITEEEYTRYMEGGIKVGEGIEKDKVGFVKHPDSGLYQVTYNGWPLYTFIGDKNPGDTNGQGKNDVWHLVRPDGSPIIISTFYHVEGSVKKENGITVTVHVIPNIPSNNRAVVVFQLVKKDGNSVEPRSIVALERQTWSVEGETLTAHFNEVGEGYEVRVYVLDGFRADPSSAENVLAEPQSYKVP